MEALAEFQTIVGPPETEIPGVNWSEIQKNLGMSFPLDYRAWAAAYPSLEIDEFLWVRHPSEFYERVGQSGIVREFRGLNRVYPIENARHFDGDGEVIDGDPSRVFFPSEGGYLPWGTTDNGDLMMWNCMGAPEQWNVVVVDGQGIFWQEFDCGFLEFLVKLLRREFISKVLPSDFPIEPAIRAHQGYDINSSGEEVAKFLPTSRWMDYFSDF